MIYQVEVISEVGVFWRVDGKLHREDGPAIERHSGYKAWCINDRLHREDGPAVVNSHGLRSWFINGTELTEEEFNNRHTVKELTVADIEALLGHKVKIVK